MRMKRNTRSWTAFQALSRKLSGPVAPGPRNAKQLTREEIATILKTNEYSKEIEGDRTVRGYTTNHLTANVTMEDRSAEAKLLSTEGTIFGVYDGHAGSMCAEVLSKTLFSYIAAALLPETGRDKICGKDKSESDRMLLENLRQNGTEQRDPDMSGVYNELRLNWINMLARTKQKLTREDSLTKAFLRMDADLGKAAETGHTMEAAMSGAVACVALIEGQDLYVAATGDCGAVLGRQTSNGRWTAMKLTKEHNAHNMKEVERLKGEHPRDERKTIIQQGRLFGSLMPLRAFGDFRYKWSVDTLERIAVPIYGRHVISANYRTPPYLTARPDVVHRLITPEDKFLVLATDGLWDVLSPEMVVQLVADLKNRSATTLRINTNNCEQIFSVRKGGDKIIMTPNDFDDNPSTYLLRAALGGSPNLIIRQLTTPLGESRCIRDDITVTVVYLKSEVVDETAPNRTNGDDKAEGCPHCRKDLPKSDSHEVNELGKGKGGSMAHSTVWEEIEATTAAASDDGRDAEGVDLDAALGSGGIIKGKTFKIAGEKMKITSDDGTRGKNGFYINEAEG